LTSQTGSALFSEGFKILTLYLYPTLYGMIETSHKVEERGLARATLSIESHHFASRYF
jgi:hypothetical protein